MTTIIQPQPNWSDNCATCGDETQQFFAIPYDAVKGEEDDCRTVCAGIICCPCICVGCLIGMPISCVGYCAGGRSRAPKINKLPSRQQMQ